MDHNFTVCSECLQTMRTTHTMSYRLFVMRRRQCDGCKKRIITYEVMQGMLERIPELREYLRKPSSSSNITRLDQGLRSVVSPEPLPPETTEDYLARVEREYEEEHSE